MPDITHQPEAQDSPEHLPATRNPAKVRAMAQPTETPGLLALRFILIGMAIAMFAALGWRAAHPPRAPEPVVHDAAPPQPVAPSFVSLEKARNAVEDHMFEDGDFEPYWSLLKDNFPADYSGLLDAFAKRSFASRRLDSVDYYMSEAIRTMRRARGLLAAQADSDLVNRIFLLQASVADAIAERDEHLCADFIYGGASEAFFTFSSTHRPLIAEMALANLAAIVDGQTSKIQRVTPTEDDFQALEDALVARGMGRPEIEALVDGKAPDPPLPDARMCAAGRAYLAALAALPEATRIRIEALVVELTSRT